VTNNNWVQPIVDGMDFFNALEEVLLFFPFSANKNNPPAI
jgi:hypothetical protein